MEIIQWGPVRLPAFGFQRYPPLLMGTATVSGDNPQTHTVVKANNNQSEVFLICRYIQKKNMNLYLIYDTKIFNVLLF